MTDYDRTRYTSYQLTIARVLFIAACACAVVATLAELNEWEHLLAWFSASVALIAAGLAVR